MISEFFTTSNYSSIQAAIDANSVIMTTINNGGHSVAITGYTESGNFIYFDPESTSWRVALPSSFSYTYII
jgi:hypothetical protein